MRSVSRVLKEVYAECSMTKRAMRMMDSFVKDVCGPHEQRTQTQTRARPNRLPLHLKVALGSHASCAPLRGLCVCVRCRLPRTALGVRVAPSFVRCVEVCSLAACCCRVS